MGRYQSFIKGGRKPVNKGKKLPSAVSNEEVVQKAHYWIVWSRFNNIGLSVGPMPARLWDGQAHMDESLAWVAKHVRESLESHSDHDYAITYFYKLGPKSVQMLTFHMETQVYESGIAQHPLQEVATRHHGDKVGQA